MSARKIALWHEAGLIDAATRDRILAYEAAHARPLALWAVFGIGALAIALGLVSVIAANWEDIPGQLRLGVHLALIAGALAALFFGEKRIAERSPWAVEALVFVTAALGLTFFGHIGQVYQTSSPLWKPLAAWLVLFAPLLLLTGRSWPTALAVLGGSVWCAWEYAGSITDLGGSDEAQSRLLLIAFVTAVPVLFAPLAAWMRDRSDRPDFWRRLEQAALAYGVGCASLATVVAAAEVFGEGGLLGGFANTGLSGAIGVFAGLGTIVARPGISGRMSGAIMAGAGFIVPLSHATDGLTVLSAILFFALWGGIAAAALAAHWRGVFQISVGVIALRLIILSFELASDLLLSGFGLIVSGFLILGVAWVAVRVSKTYAPPAEPEA